MQYKQIRSKGYSIPITRGASIDSSVRVRQGMLGRAEGFGAGGLYGGLSRVGKFYKER